MQQPCVAHAQKRWHFIKAKKFEQQFDDGADITASLDLSKARRVLQEHKRVNVDFPTWMVDSLDREASKLGGDEAVRDQGLAGRAPSGDEFSCAVTTDA